MGLAEDLDYLCTHILDILNTDSSFCFYGCWGQAPELGLIISLCL